MWVAGLGVNLTVMFGTLCVDRLSPRSKLLGGRTVCIMRRRLGRDTFLTSVFEFSLSCATLLRSMF